MGASKMESMLDGQAERSLKQKSHGRLSVSQNPKEAKSTGRSSVSQSSDPLIKEPKPLGSLSVNHSSDAVKESLTSSSTGSTSGSPRRVTLTSSPKVASGVSTVVSTAASKAADSRRLSSIRNEPDLPTDSLIERSQSQPIEPSNSQDGNTFTSDECGTWDTAERRNIDNRYRGFGRFNSRTLLTSPPRNHDENCWWPVGIEKYARKIVLAGGNTDDGVLDAPPRGIRRYCCPQWACYSDIRRHNHPFYNFDVKIKTAHLTQSTGDDKKQQSAYMLPHAEERSMTLDQLLALYFFVARKRQLKLTSIDRNIYGIDWNFNVSGEILAVERMDSKVSVKEV
ncbi:hypothetical protein F2Q70_00007216 [Brassica cretica]|uniref:Uncharacterized protein n=1 Tax=Brassica cretica TaxID=69181 RepID=A0A8S9LU53_BRACR|nr:hypothetical protein F2Q70_00007216 [Brassica cretica]